VFRGRFVRMETRNFVTFAPTRATVKPAAAATGCLTRHRRAASAAAPESDRPVLAELRGPPWKCCHFEYDFFVTEEELARSGRPSSRLRERAIENDSTDARRNRRFAECGVALHHAERPRSTFCSDRCRSASAIVAGARRIRGMSGSGRAGHAARVAARGPAEPLTCSECRGRLEGGTAARCALSPLHGRALSAPSSGGVRGEREAEG
jgi:hypothetical protein